jgi:hypothetical protein
VLMGPGWLTETCSGPTLNLYALPNGPWKTLRLNGGSLGGLCGGSGVDCRPDAVGTDWVEIVASCYHCGTTLAYLSTSTRAEGTPMLSAARRLDLSSPTLTKPVCSPLSIPAADPITYFGSYAVVKEFSPGRSDTPYVLYRCGTKVHEALGHYAPGLLGNSRIIGWRAQKQGPLAGPFLPSRQRFMLTLPAAFRNLLLTVNLTSRYILVYASPLTLFSSTRGEGLWSAPLPTPPAPRRRTAHRGH